MTAGDSAQDLTGPRERPPRSNRARGASTILRFTSPPGALLFDTMGLFDDMKARMDKFSKDVDKAISGKPKTGPGHTLGGACFEIREARTVST